LLRLREYGGNLKNDIKYSREEKIETSTMLDFSGSLSTSSGVYDSDGIYEDLPYIKSGFLSGSRLEVGFPEPQGTMVSIPDPAVASTADLESRHGISNNANDGLFTSGSFLFEGIYSFPVDREYSEYQSLLRVNADGKTYNNVVLNVVAHSSSIDPANHELKCFITPTNISSPSVPKIELVITGVNIFDGSKWNIAAGRDRFDEIENNVSSSYYMKCTRQMFGEIKEYHTAVDYYEELDHTFVYSESTSSGLSLTLPITSDTITWTLTDGSEITSTYDGSDWSNPTGFTVVVTEGGGLITDIVITDVSSGTTESLSTIVPVHTYDPFGSAAGPLITGMDEDALRPFEGGVNGSDIFSLRDGDFNELGHFFSIGEQSFATTPGFLNSFDPTSVEMTTAFEGKVGHLRMWSKGFTDAEWKEHVRNYTSLGVVSPFDNFNFNTHATGSFQRLRVDTSTDQADTAANSSGTDRKSTRLNSSH
jgi:hypothetical protein